MNNNLVIVGLGTIGANLANYLISKNFKIVFGIKILLD